MTLSFVGATIFWFFSALGKDYTTRISYPIHFQFDRDSHIAIKKLPENVDIDVTGVGWDLFRQSFWFGANPIQIDLDNPSVVRYLTRSTIRPLVGDQLSQFRINFLLTDTLNLRIDEKTSKKVALQVDSLAIDLDIDYRLTSSITIAPDSAIVFGPRSFIDTLADTYTIALRQDQIDKPFARSVALGLPDAFQIASEPYAVNVSFEVDKFDKMSLPTEVEMLNFPPDSSVYVSSPEILVQFVIQRELRKEFDRDDFKVVVDFSMINERDSMAPAIVVFQPDYVIEAITLPDSVSISYAE